MSLPDCVVNKEEDLVSDIFPNLQTSLIFFGCVVTKFCVAELELNLDQLRPFLKE